MTAIPITLTFDSSAIPVGPQGPQGIPGLNGMDGLQGPPGVGIGVSVTDFPTEQNAVDFLASQGGGVLVYPPGLHVGPPVFVETDNIHVWAYGAVLKLEDSPAADQFPRISVGILRDQSATVPVDRFSFRGGEIDGNKANQFNGSDESCGKNSGIGCWQVSRLLIEDVVVHDCDGYGIGLSGTDKLNRSDFRVRNVELYGNSYDGLDIKGGSVAWPLRIWLENIYSHDNGGGPIPSRAAVGMDLRGQYVWADRCQTDRNQEAGLRLRENQCRDALVRGHRSFGNSTEGYRVDGMPGGLYRFDGCQSGQNDLSGWRIEADTTLVDCVSDGDESHGVHNASNACTINVTGGRYTNAGTDGINIAVASGLAVSADARIQGNGRDGIRFAGARLSVGGAIIKNNGKTSIGRGVTIVGTSTPAWRVAGADIFDDQPTKTQTHAIAFSGSPPAGQLLGNDMRGNLTGPVTGTVPAGTIIDNNLGYPL